MARSAVTVKIPVTKIEKTVAGHTFSVIESCYLLGYASVTNSATQDYTAVSSELTIPLDLPASCLITSMSFPLMNKATDATTDGSSFAVVVESTEYGVDANGNVTGSGFVQHLNNYKSQHGDFPSIRFLIGSWLLKPASGTHYVSFQMSHPIVNCTMEEGSNATFRPTADISVGHDIASGFSGVYQLLNETVADDDGSYIRSYTDDGDVDERTSVVVAGISLPNGKRMIQLRPVIRVSILYSNTSSKDGIHATLTLSVDDVSETYKVTDLVSPSHSTSYSYLILESDTYNTFECIFDLDSPLIDAINSYYMKNNRAPEVRIAIQTSAKGTDQSGYKSANSAEVRVSQVYFEAAYEESLDVCYNIDGIWEQPRVVYRKNNGRWLKVSNTEAINQISSRAVFDKCKLRGHVEEPIPDVVATCVRESKTGGTSCTFCGKTVKPQVIGSMDPNNHAYPTTHERKEPTCGSDGYEAYQDCNAWFGCGAYITPKVVLPATGNHTFVDGVCSVCGASQS